MRRAVLAFALDQSISNLRIISSTEYNLDFMHDFGRVTHTNVWQPITRWSCLRHVRYTCTWWYVGFKQQEAILRGIKPITPTPLSLDAKVIIERNMAFDNHMKMIVIGTLPRCNYFLSILHREIPALLIYAMVRRPTKFDKNMSKLSL